MIACSHFLEVFGFVALEVGALVGAGIAIGLVLSRDSKPKPPPYRGMVCRGGLCPGCDACD